VLFVDLRNKRSGRRQRFIHLHKEKKHLKKKQKTILFGFLQKEKLPALAQVPCAYESQI
jgi:hypothetical protein